MKIVIALFMLTGWLFSATIHWEQSLFDAKLKSSKTLKPIFVLLTRDDCPWCKKLEATTLRDFDIINAINIKYIPVHLVNGAENAKALFGSGITPRCIFLDPNGKEVYSIPGYWTVDEFKDGLDDADEALLNMKQASSK